MVFDLSLYKVHSKEPKQELIDLIDLLLSEKLGSIFEKDLNNVVLM